MVIQLFPTYSFFLPLHTRLISLAISKACSKLGVAVEVQQLSWISAKGLEITFVKVCTKEGVKERDMWPVRVLCHQPEQGVAIASSS